MYKLSKRSLDTMVGVNPDLVKVIKEAIVNSPFDFMITQGVRTAKYQNQLYQQGRTQRGLKVTNADGYIKKSAPIPYRNNVIIVYTVLSV